MGWKHTLDQKHQLAQTYWIEIVIEEMKVKVSQKGWLQMLFCMLS